MKRRDLLRSALVLPLAGSLPASPEPLAPSSGRAFWLAHLQRVARPVLESLANNRLKASMPIEAHAGMEQSRTHTTHLEAFGRLLSGIAPWLEFASAPDAEQQSQYVQ